MLGNENDKVLLQIMWEEIISIHNVMVQKIIHVYYVTLFIKSDSTDGWAAMLNNLLNDNSRHLK